MEDQFDYWKMAQEAQDEVDRVWEALGKAKATKVLGAAEQLKKQNNIRHLEIILTEQRGNVRLFLRRAISRGQITEGDLLRFAGRIKRGMP